MLAFADTSVLSRSYAARFGTEDDQDQELRALGAANLATGLFQGFPISSSSSRTPVAESAGAKTQLTGVIGAISLGAILVFANGLFRDLPTAVLAAIVIVAMIGLVDLAGFRRLARVHHADFLLSMICVGGVAVFGVLWGIGIAIGLSVLAFFWRAWHPYDAVLGRATGVKGYHDITRYPEARQVPGLIIYRFDAPLFFANANIFRERLSPPCGKARFRSRPSSLRPSQSPTSTRPRPTCSPRSTRSSNPTSIELAFAELKDPVKDRLRRFGLVERIGHERFYPTIGMAVRRFVEEHDVDWVDWEEAGEWVPATSATT